AAKDTRRDEQLQRACSFSTNEINRDGLRQRRSGRQQIRRRGHRGQTISERCERQIASRRWRGYARDRLVGGWRIRRGGEDRRLVIVHAFDETRYPAQARRNGGGEPLASGNHQVTAAAAANQQRLQHTMFSNRLDECRRRRFLVVLALRVEALYLEKSNGRIQQPRI